MLKALEDMLISLRKASKDLAFYPAGHPLLKTSLEQTVQQLRTVAKSQTPLMLAVSRTGFAFDGQPLGKESRQLAAMAAELFVRRIQKIFFAEGFGQGDLAGFLRMTMSDPRQLAQQGGPANVLAAHGVGRIQVNEFDFRRAAAPALDDADEALPPPGTVPQAVPTPEKAPEESDRDPTSLASLVAAPDSQEEPTVEALIQRLEQEATSGGAAGYEWAASRLEKAAGQAVQDDCLKDVLAVLRPFLRHRRADTLKASLRERAALLTLPE